MKWIVSTNTEIYVGSKQMFARKEYIHQATGSNVSDWVIVDAPVLNKFFCCTSDDGLDGIVITAHIGDIFEISKVLCDNRIFMFDFVVANTCIWGKGLEKKLLYLLMSRNRKTELFFAKQELSLEEGGLLRQSVTLKDFGCFGFPTSFSERELFRNRNIGLFEAIEKSFNRVSPVIEVAY